MPVPPQPPSLVLTALSPGGRADLADEREHDGVDFTDADLSGLRAPDLDLVECLFSGNRLDDVVLTGGRWRECRVERCEATSLRLDAATWREVEVDGCRFGALEAYDAEIRQVTVTQSRLGYVNLRGAHLVDVSLHGCQVEDLDLGSARVERLLLTDCTIGHLLLPGAELTDVDLRGAVLSQVTSPDRLRGTTITAGQLDQLAPVLAEHLGIEVG